ncbi:MAG: phospho-N-acetylmuramoyl-pentapeptide-transferase [Aquificae bacterium]|nr:phospho-N-acetylmuramoyl-pentapeptide-transferase [Aquificota bacterium]
MFYHLFYEVFDINLFKYITFRGFYALFTSFFITLLIAPFIIEKLKKFQSKAGGYVREYTGHENKQFTPTMGGIFIVIAVVISSLLWNRLDNFYVWVVLFTMVSFAIIGGIDDYLKIKNKKGISSKTKFALQIIFATVIALLIYFYPQFDTHLYFPFIKELQIDLGLLYIPFIVFIIVGTSNAVNLTDGLDGLAIGPSVIAVSTFSILAYVSGNSKLASYLLIPYVADSGELTVFLMALLGAGLGFLWFNSFPAEVFMGDAGSLSIGAVLGTVAVIIKQEIILAIVGGVFVAETLSVIAQVLSYKLTGRRIFLMAPLHHHFEKKGVEENKIVIRTWIISILLAVFALSTLKIR